MISMFSHISHISIAGVSIRSTRLFCSADFDDFDDFYDSDDLYDSDDSVTVKTGVKTSLRGRNFFLTYPNALSISKEEILNQLSSITEKKPIRNYIISEEKHRSGAPHFHVYLSIPDKFQTRNHNTFDLVNWNGDVLKGKYQVLRPNMSTKVETICYILKDKNYLTNFSSKELLEIFTDFYNLTSNFSKSSVSNNSSKGSISNNSRSINSIVSEKSSEKGLKTKKLSRELQNELLELALTSGVPLAMDHFSCSRPDLVLSSFNSIQKNLIKYKENKLKIIPFKAYYPLSGFENYEPIVDWLENHSSTKTLFLNGPSGYGKTELMASLLESYNPLIINDINALTLLTDANKCIVFDDMDWSSITRPNRIGLVDPNRFKDIRVLFTTVRIPVGIKKVVLSNFQDDLFKSNIDSMFCDTVSNWEYPIARRIHRIEAKTSFIKSDSFLDDTNKLDDAANKLDDVVTIQDDYMDNEKRREDEEAIRNRVYLIHVTTSFIKPLNLDDSDEILPMYMDDTEESEESD